MNTKTLFRIALCALVGMALALPASGALAEHKQATAVTAYDLIVAMNTLRVSYGLPALVEDPIIDAVAQSTAQTMAANNLSGHIGNASGRVQAAGYGGGARVFATENIAMGFDSIDEIMLVWSDAAHMIPAVNPAYCNIGAGVALSASGVPYYVLQAAYIGVKACGQYTSVAGPTLQPGGSTGVTLQHIVPVQTATPEADGRVFHTIKNGQTLWAIAIAYKVTVKDLQIWNGLGSSTIVVVGKKLLIPGSSTQGYATPTPVGRVQTSTPDATGKVVHVVQAYQNLTTIAEAYKVSVDTLLRLNGLALDAPLQISQKLVIVQPALPPTNTATSTPRPLTPIEKLTPAADGNYYHQVKAGENPSTIAALYKVQVTDLMAWNKLAASAVLQPGQKLLLNVTPPPTLTFTPLPATQTPTPAPPTASATASPAPTRTVTPPAPTATPTPETGSAGFDPIWIIVIAVVGAIAALVVIYVRKTRGR